MSMDAALFRWINVNLGWDAIEPFMKAVSDFRLFVPFVLLAAAWMGFRDGRRGRFTLLALLLTVPLTDQVSSHLLKPWVGRPRPCRAEAGIEGVKTHGTHCSGRGSFPSSHAANSSAAAMAIASRYPVSWVPAVAMLILVGWSRVYLGVHYPGDVLGGWVLGGLLGWAGAWAAGRMGARSRGARRGSGPGG